MQGRRKLLLRLGAEARDPIEELLASALEFETTTSHSLQRFLDWFARGDVEIVRDPSAPLDAVRVMTVHGSKGLQSPVVILADSCVDPSRARSSTADFRIEADGPDIPVLRPRKDEMAEPLKSQIEAQDRLDRQEHWRLLYVAMTRAEERLYIGGLARAADKKGPPDESWFTAASISLGGLGSDWEEDPHWGSAIRHGEAEVPAKAASAPEKAAIELPAWAKQPAPSRSARRARSRPRRSERTMSPTLRPRLRFGIRRFEASSFTNCSSGFPQFRRISAPNSPSAGSNAPPGSRPSVSPLAHPRLLRNHRRPALCRAVQRRGSAEAPIAAVIGAWSSPEPSTGF
jgi:ATP-dependent helicase/nuclease subunit A